MSASRIPTTRVSSSFEQALEREVRERRVGDALEITEPVGGDARLHCGDSGASYGSSRSRTASLKPTSAARCWNA